MLTSMAELDYAYLADYAQIEGGKISSLGASYTHAAVPVMPSAWMTSVVGRVRADDDCAPVPIRIEVTSPDNGYKVAFEDELPRTADVRPYRGRVGLLFTITAQLPLVTPGLYTFDIYVDGEHARRLAFEAEIVAES